MITIIGCIDNTGSDNLDKKLKIVYENQWHNYKCNGWKLKIKLDSCYKIYESAHGIIIHDSRINKWEDDPRNWNGSFLAIKYPEKNKPSINIYSDRLGTIPIYIVEKGAQVYFSSKLTLLAKIGFKTLDKLAVWQLLLFNQPLWKRSLLYNVVLQPPATCTELSYEKPPIHKRYWHTSSNLVETSTNIIEYAESLISILKEAHQRFIITDKHTNMLPVTGGLDSRLNIALNLHNLSDVELFHSEAKGDPDSEVAYKIAKRLKKKIFVTSTADALRKSLYLDPDDETGELNFSQSWLKYIAKQVSHKFSNPVWWDGYMQDVLFNPHLINKKQHAEIDRQLQIAKYRLNLLGFNSTDKLFTKLFDLFLEEYKNDNKDTLTNNLDYYLENRSRRYILGTVRLAQNYMPVLLPGIDNDVLTYGLHLPWNYRKGGIVYRETINQLAPMLAKIADSKTGLPLTSSRKQAWHKYLENILQNNLERFWPSRPIFANPISSIDELLRQDQNYKNEIFKTLKTSDLVCEYINHEKGIEYLFDLHRKGRNIGGVLQGLMTLAKFQLWIE